MRHTGVLLLGFVLVLGGLGPPVRAGSARMRLTCHDGNPASARVRRRRPVRRHGYPFCVTDGEPDGTCHFSFCPSLGAVVGCDLDPHCLGDVILCTDAGWESRGDRYEVAAGKTRAVPVPGGASVGLRCRARR